MTIVESRARLLTETETKKLGCTSSSCPEYLLSAEEYWLSTSNAETAYAYMINSTGLIHAYYTTNSRGVRPVITVPKN